MSAAVRWRLHLWDAFERKRFWETMMAAWDKCQDLCIAYRSKYFRPESPNVVPFTIDELTEMQARGINWRDFQKKGK